MEKVYEELAEAKAQIERLTANFDDKESIIKQLSSANDTLRADYNEKLKKLEEENSQLSLSVDEANENDREKQLRFDALTNEAESLKALVSVLQLKCSEAEKRNQSPKKWDGDHLLEELEDKQKKVENELKWKMEQFKHLEEAHEKLREQFRVSQNEWETEKSSFLDEITKLQESLGDGHQTAEGFKGQLDKCKQALDHEERRRNALEIQVSEMKSLLENVSNGSWEGKFEMDCLTVQRDDDEVATLRHSLRVKEMECKDLEYKVKNLETNNRELLSSIKELQEAHIPKATTPQSSWAKLRSKHKTLEQTHKNCSVNLRAKEAEWSAQAQKMTQELTHCSSSLKIKEQVIEELKKEVQQCHSSLTQLKLQNEELSLMLQLKRPEFSEAGSDQQSKDKEGAGDLMEQLETKNSFLAKRHSDFEKELNMCKEMLDESSKCQLKLMGETAEMERKLTNELREVHDNLQRLDSELTEQTNERGELEFELQVWKSIAERLKMQLEESQAMRKELEASLLAQAEVEEMLKTDTEEKDQRISNLEQQIMLFDQEIMISEDITTEEMIGRTFQRFQIDVDDDEDQQEQELLAKELEVAIIAHIMEDRACEKQAGNLHQIEVFPEQSLLEDTVQSRKVGRTGQEFEEVCGAKENVDWRHCSVSKTGESIIEERSPFREVN